MNGAGDGSASQLQQAQQTAVELSAKLVDLMSAVRDFIHAKKYMTIPEQYRAEQQLIRIFNRIEHK